MSSRDGRNSRGSLPLPTSLSASNTPPVQVPAPSSTRLPLPSSSPTSANFPLHSIHSPSSLPSSTHAGGIQPSSLFFRPARPVQQPQYSPQPSLRNDEHNGEDNYPLTPLSSSFHPQDHKRRSVGQQSIDDYDSAANAPEDPHASQFSSLTRSKYSHEPLLPISGPSHSRRPSVLSANSPPTSPKKLTAGRVRTSLDRVFGLSFTNRLSLDSIRNRNDFPFDEERVDTPTKIPVDSPVRFINGRTSHAHPSRSPSPAPSHSSSASAGSASPAPSFIATPPTPTPGSKVHPLSHTPLLRQGSSKPVRNYEHHPSRNRFFLSGRLLTGGDSPYAFIVCLCLLIGLASLWFSTTCVFWWHHSAGSKAIVIIGAYCAALVLSTMLTTATTDPGILPRGLDPDPPFPPTGSSDGSVRAPMPRDLKVRTDVVRVKYCPTCQTYRPPRSSHCKMCNNCVDGCDHHCQWVNNCIGRRNYTTFFALLCAATITLLLVIITSALHIWLLTTMPSASGQDPNLRHALSDHKAIGSAVAFCLSVVIIWPVGALLAYHARLLLLNVTTIEMIRSQAHKSIPGATKPPNPFSHGSYRRNVFAVLCRPRGYSWLQPHEVTTEDLREVNPGVRGAAGGRGRRES